VVCWKYLSFVKVYLSFVKEYVLSTSLSLRNTSLSLRFSSDFSTSTKRKDIGLLAVASFRNSSAQFLRLRGILILVSSKVVR